MINGVEKFVSKYISTIGIDYGVKPVRIADNDVRVNFWDLSGQPEFLEVRNEFYKDTQVSFSFSCFPRTSCRLLKHTSSIIPIHVHAYSVIMTM
jgi:hypothetical protein